ncbi:MAG: PorV/PorQ family protein [Candidatus Marinimicrobia bacterium]|nr:PorV/PorQ family protein [Candidatus Neomarinimicrobiota bacterium]
MQRTKSHIKTTRGAILLLLCAVSLFAEEFQKTGTTGFVFLNLPVSARYSAMGETGISSPNGQADGMFINPALIAHTRMNNAFSATYGQWYLGTGHHAASYVRKIPTLGSLGVFMNLFDFGEMERTRFFAPEEVNSFSGDENNIYMTLGTFEAGAYALGLSYARQMTDKFTVGANLKYVREFIAEYHAQNVLVDMGFFYQTTFSSLRIGAFLKNFGLETQYVNEKFKMPQQMTLGISFEPYGSLEDPTYLSLNIEAVHPNDMSEHINIGFESRIANLLILRGGYKFGYEYENLTAGLGIHFVFKARSFDLDMSFMHHQYMNTTLRYTLNMEL